jgi:hypothetical protein
MLIPLGILDYPVSAAVASDYDLLETEILTGSQASVTFDVTGLGSTYQHLQIRYAVRSDRADTIDFSQVTFNADTGTNYSIHYLRGDGSSASSLGLTSQNFMWGGFSTTANSSASTFSPSVIDILDPFETTKFTTIRALSGINTTETSVALFSGLWMNTNALTSITLDNYGSNWVTGSRFSLMGLKAA